MLGNTDFIGIDIGQYAIKLARLKKSGKSFVCNFLGYEIIPEEIRANKDKKALQEFMNQILKSYKISKGQPVIHMSIGEAILRHVILPDNTTKEGMEGAIELDLGNSLPFGIDQVYYDFDEKPGKDGSYLAVAARRDLIDGKTALLNGRVKTLNGPQVDLDAFAFERLIEAMTHNGTIVGSTIGILDIGYLRSRIFVYQNAQYVFAREPQIGGNTVNEIIRDVYDMDIDSAEGKKLNQNFGDEYEELVLNPYINTLSEQINLAIDFYEASAADSTKLDMLYVTGGGALLRGLIEGLRSTIVVPVDVLNLSSHIKLQSGQSEIFQTGLNHSLSIGLAMEGK